jgi:pimeloyl-ACP methyl ester carboxylesterase
MSSIMQRLTDHLPDVSRHEVAIDSRSVRYQVTGHGEPLVLVHGLSGSSRWWWRNVPELARRHTVYLLDLPGFGEMRGDEAGFVLGESAWWMSAWMDEIGLERASFVGHSLGGYICIKLAADRPELVGRLILVAPAGVPTGRSIPGYAIPLLRAARQLRPRFATVLARDFLRAGPLTILRAAREILDEDVANDLRRIEVPTLLIWGDSDPMIPPTLAHVVREEIGHARLLCFEEIGHVPMIDRAREFNEAVLAFLRGEPVGE